MSALTNEVGIGSWFIPGLPAWNLSYNTGCPEFKDICTLDAAAEKVVLYGYIFIDGMAASKTLSSSGGKIHLLPGTVAWSTAGTTVRVGLQDPSTSAGPTFQPDGTFDVYGDLIQGTDSLSSNTWKTVTMSSGTKTLSTGVLVAIVCDMTTRNGSDIFRLRGIEGASLSSCPSHVPAINTYASAAWGANPVSGWPIALVEFDDGTLGYIFGTIPVSSFTTQAYVAADSPDEKCLIFKFPTERKINAIGGMVYQNNAVSDFDAIIYSDPLGTPSAVATISFLGEHSVGFGSPRNWQAMLSSAITIAANTDYALAIKATSTGNVGFVSVNVNNANYRKFLPGGTNCRMGHRTDGSGAFTETTTAVPILGVNMYAFHDGAGGGGGSTPYVIGS